MGGVAPGDIIVEVNDQLLGDHFSEEDLLILLTELERPVIVGFKRSGLILDDTDEYYSDDSDSEYGLDGNSNIELSPITAIPDDDTERSEEATAFFQSLMHQAALSPNTPVVPSPTTAELRISQDSPGMFIEQPRLLKASPPKSDEKSRPNRSQSTSDVTASKSRPNRSQSSSDVRGSSNSALGASPNSSQDLSRVLSDEASSFS